MNKQKQTYLSPETETLVIRFEGVVYTSPLQTLGMISIPGADQGFGDSAADVQDLSGENNWW